MPNTTSKLLWTCLFSEWTCVLYTHTRLDTDLSELWTCGGPSSLQLCFPAFLIQCEDVSDDRKRISNLIGFCFHANVLLQLKYLNSHEYGTSLTPPSLHCLCMKSQRAKTWLCVWCELSVGMRADSTSLSQLCLVTHGDHMDPSHVHGVGRVGQEIR